MKILHPFLNVIGEVFDHMGGRLAEEIHTHDKKDHIDNARNNDPFPQIVFLDETMRFEIGLYRYDEIFQQMLVLFECLCKIQPNRQIHS